jgi:hypothetical protein
MAILIIVYMKKWLIRFFLFWIIFLVIIRIATYLTSHQIREGQGRYELKVSTKEHHDQWMIINFSFFFWGGDLNQPCRFIIKMDDNEMHNMTLKKHSYGGIPYRYYFPRLQTPVHKSDSATIIIEPLEGKFKSSFWFKVYFLKEHIH